MAFGQTYNHSAGHVFFGKIDIRRNLYKPQLVR